jgi:hypothetical protein
MHGTFIIVPVMHQQRSEARLSPSGDTEDIESRESIEDIVLRLAPRLAYFAGVARTEHVIRGNSLRKTLPKSSLSSSLPHATRSMLALTA